MERVRDFVKEHICITVILFGAPLVILVIFLLRQPLTDSEWVTLTGGLLSYYGTVILAIVTVMQNDSLLKMEKRTLEIEKRNSDREEIKCRMDFHPDIEFSGFLDSSEKPVDTEKVRKTGVGPALQYTVPEGGGDTIYLVLKNSGNATALDITVLEYAIDLGSENLYGYKVTTLSSIPAGETKLLQYTAEKGKRHEYLFNLKYKNEFNQCFYNTAYMLACFDGANAVFRASLGNQGYGDVEFGLKKMEDA